MAADLARVEALLEESQQVIARLKQAQVPS